ncbi:hypothetical protein QL285_075436 [Trifolium repens]|nr:hypothetical protein QL285_075436 [Trifolium repens]
MLTPGEVTQILSPTHWHNRAPTATLNEFTTQKLTSQQRFTTSSSQRSSCPQTKFPKSPFSPPRHSQFPRFTQSSYWLPSKEKHRNFLRTSKTGKTSQFQSTRLRLLSTRD